KIAERISCHLSCDNSVNFRESVLDFSTPCKEFQRQQPSTLRTCQRRVWRYELQPQLRLSKARWCFQSALPTRSNLRIVGTSGRPVWRRRNTVDGRFGKSAR